MGLKGIKYGKVKAIANNLMSQGPVAIGRLFYHIENNIGVEAHLHKIMEARTKRRYNRKVKCQK